VQHVFDVPRLGRELKLTGETTYRLFRHDLVPPKTAVKLLALHTTERERLRKKGTYAALAMMRSIMEAVLRDHYSAMGKDLNERIRNVRGRLPPRANEGALHRLRKLANAILHLDREKNEGLPKMNESRLEKEIVSLLHVLRALIEGTK
jgi:hypothetical protein